MRYKTNVEVRTNGRSYPPGSVLPENISPADLVFLKAKRFIVPTDETGAALAIDAEEFEREFEGLLEGEEAVVIKSPDEILKMRSKKEVFAYAESIGCDLGEDYSGNSLKEMREAVIDFQEESLDENAGEAP